MGMSNIGPKHPHAVSDTAKPHEAHGKERVEQPDLKATSDKTKMIREKVLKIRRASKDFRAPLSAVESAKKVPKLAMNASKTREP